MTKVRSLLLTFCLLPGLAAARDQPPSSWESLAAVKPGARIEVTRKTGDPVRGDFSTFGPDSITVVAKQQQVVVPRMEVVRITTNRKGHAKWFGLAIGAGAGAGAGAALGERLANESAGDLNLKGLSTAAVAAAGALIGLGIGAALDSRHSTVYQVN